MGLKAIWFDEYSLSDNDIYFTFVSAFIGASIVMIVSKILFGHDIKRLSWCISLVNSFVMTVVGIFYVTYKLMLVKTLPCLTSENFLGKDNVSTITCIIFAVFNICDLLYGLIFYRKYLGFLTAYVHHTLYIWLMYFAVTGNGLFTINAPFAPGFMWNIIEELPTFLLALGSIFPSFRTDFGFGVTFLVLRILYHFYLTVFAIRSGAYGYTVLFVYLLSLTQHLNWFYTWFTKYGSKLLQSPSNKRNLSE